MENTYQTVLSSAVRAATNSSQTYTNYGSRGLHLVIDATSGKYYDLLVGVAMATTGTQVLKLFPGITAVANASSSDTLPSAWRATMTHSAATNFTYSVGASLIG